MSLLGATDEDEESENDIAVEIPEDSVKKKSKFYIKMKLNLCTILHYEASCSYEHDEH